MSPELTNCPFCGSGGEELGLRVAPYSPTPKGHWNVQCYVCNVETALQDTEAEAITAWNRRADQRDAGSEGSGEWREAIARIIDAEAFKADAEVFATAFYGSASPGRVASAESRLKRRQIEALAKADAILALISPAPVLGEKDEK